MLKNHIWLQLFADGGAGAGADGGNGGSAAAAGEAAQAEQRLPARGKRQNPLENVVYGKQPQQAQVQSVAAKTESDAPASFRELIDGQYKADFEAEVHRIIQDRLRGSREREAKTAPIIERVAKRYGMDAKAEDFDLTALNDAIDGDLSQYEAEAVEKGLDVETVAKLHKLEDMQAKEQARAEQGRIQSHLEGLLRQGEALKATYPNFDLEKELQNPDFVRLTAPGVGVPVKTAYEAVHADELRSQMMQFTAQKAAQKVSASVAANAKRPAENGVKGSSGAVNKSDPSTLKLNDFREIARRAERGEKIYF